VLELHLAKKICSNLSRIGEELNLAVGKIVSASNLTGLLQLSGHPSWTFLGWKQLDQVDLNEVKTLFMQEMFQEGVLVLSTHNISTSLSQKYLTRVIGAYEKTLAKIANSVETNDFSEVLRAKPLQPLFKIR
jgi:glutamate-1-semialdehyde 2,1-aminomutase